MPHSKMKLVIIDHKDVEAHSENYNSYFHSSIEAPSLLIPDESPYAYNLWLPLIARSRKIPENLIQTITLSASQCRILIQASKASIQTRELNRMFKEELDEEIAPSFNSLAFPPEGLFMRLDACSPKDGVNGLKPLTGVQEIILKLMTSGRACNAMSKSLEKGEESVRVFFLPYNEKMSTAREFRVFCTPGTGRVTGVSQYKWHAPFFFAPPSSPNLETLVHEVVESVLEGIEGIHELIMEVLNKAQGTERSEMAAMALKQGFSFDVMWHEDSKKATLIELNIFGARSGCGSCLFHWIRDMEVLNGDATNEAEGEKEVEFRISM
jgi:hypothetical protein